MANDQADQAVAIRSETSVEFTERLNNFSRLAKGVVDAKLCPRNMEAPAVVVAMQLGHELGLSPMQSVQSVNVINGKATLSGEAAVALIRSSGLCEAWDMGTRGEGEAMVGFATTKRRDDATKYGRTFSIANARLAGLWGKQGPWKQYPDRMLMWRAVGFLSRDVYPDAMRGARITEEADDIPMGDTGHGEMRDVTPAKELPPQAAATVLEVIGAHSSEDSPVPHLSPPPEHVGTTESDVSDEGPEIDPATGQAIPTQAEIDAAFTGSDDDVQAAFDGILKK